MASALHPSLGCREAVHCQAVSVAVFAKQADMVLLQLTRGACLHGQDPHRFLHLSVPIAGEQALF